MTVEEGLTEPVIELLVLVELVLIELELVFIELVLVELLVFEADELDTPGVMSEPDDDRYQFATGSPKHSPTVTGLNPFEVNC